MLLILILVHLDKKENVQLVICNKQNALQVKDDLCQMEYHPFALQASSWDIGFDCPTTTEQILSTIL